MSCKLCKQIKNWKGDDVVCPFSDNDSLFNTDNWRCGCVSKLRRLILQVDEGNYAKHYLKHIYYNEQHQVLFDIQDLSEMGILGRPDMLEGVLGLYMNWYKSTGRVNSIYLMLDNGSVRIPTFTEIKHINEGLLILLEG